jgi:hypothetical protein
MAEFESAAATAALALSGLTDAQDGYAAAVRADKVAADALTSALRAQAQADDDLALKSAMQDRTDQAVAIEVKLEAAWDEVRYWQTLANDYHEKIDFYSMLISGLDYSDE